MTVTVSAPVLDRLSDAALDLARDLTNLYALANSEDQLTLPLDGEAMANEAFMEEREQLKAVIGQQAEEIGRCNAAIHHVARYNTALQNGLNQMGIRFTPDEDGNPQIEVNPEALAAFMLNI